MSSLDASRYRLQTWRTGSLLAQYEILPYAAMVGRIASLSNHHDFAIRHADGSRLDRAEYVSITQAVMLACREDAPVHTTTKRD